MRCMLATIRATYKNIHLDHDNTTSGKTWGTVILGQPADPAVVLKSVKLKLSGLTGPQVSKITGASASSINKWTRKALDEKKATEFKVAQCT